MVTKAYNDPVSFTFNDAELGTLTITAMPVQEAANLKILFRIAQALERL